MSSKSGKIEEVVRQKPGIGFSQLKEETGFCNGVLQYHIRNSTEIIEEKGAYMPQKYCEGCELSAYCKNQCILKEVRKDSTKAILSGFSKGLNQTEIADKVGKDRSTINYHIQKLREMNVIREDGSIIDAEFVRILY